MTREEALNDPCIKNAVKVTAKKGTEEGTVAYLFAFNFTAELVVPDNCSPEIMVALMADRMKEELPDILDVARYRAEDAKNGL